MRVYFTIAMVLVLSITFSMAMAASDRCVVVSSEENMLTLECKRETESFKSGMEVKIKTSRKAPVEGC